MVEWEICEEGIWEVEKGIFEEGIVVVEREEVGSDSHSHLPLLRLRAQIQFSETEEEMAFS